MLQRASLSDEALLTDDELTAFFRSDPRWNDINKLVSIDACFSGGFWGQYGSDTDLQSLPNVALLASAIEQNFGYFNAGTGISYYAESLANAIRSVYLKGNATVGDILALMKAEASRPVQPSAQGRSLRISGGVLGLTRPMATDCPSCICN